MGNHAPAGPAAGADRGVGDAAAQAGRRRPHDPQDADRLPLDPQARRARRRDRRNPIPLVAKPKQQVKRAPRPIAPYLVERIRALLLDPPERRDRRGRRVPARPESLRLRDATLVALLAYAGPRPESEALPMTFGQIGRRTLTFRATKGGTVVERETRLLEPLPATCRAGGCMPRSGDEDLVFPGADGARWSGDDWDNWRERIFRPPRGRSGCPPTRARATCAGASRAC